MMSAKMATLDLLKIKLFLYKVYDAIIPVHDVIIKILSCDFHMTWSWFKFNNLRLALGTNLKFYTSAAKALKLKVGKFLGLIPTSVEVTGGKLVGGTFLAPCILNRITMVFLESKKVIESLTTGLRYSEKHCKILRTFCVNIRKIKFIDTEYCTY